MKEGMHGEMSYMEKWHDKRLDPRKLLEGAKSVICLMHNYYTDKEPDSPRKPLIAKYARGKDYHWVLKDKITLLVEFIKSQIGETKAQICVDSTPVLEKAWAAKAGLGWIGKNSLLLNRESGSFFLLAELIVDLELEYDEPVADQCADCRICIDACPTGAIVEPRVVDSRKCLSYLTIECSDELPVNLKKKFGNRIFGCDTCQDVCPYNRGAKPHGEPLFEAKPEIYTMSRADWQKMTRGTYMRLFKGTAVTRRGFKGLKKNVVFVFGNGE